MCQDPETSPASLRKSEKSSLAEAKGARAQRQKQVWRGQQGPDCGGLQRPQWGGGLDVILSMMRSHWRTMSKEASLSGL